MYGEVAAPSSVRVRSKILSGGESSCECFTTTTFFPSMSSFTPSSNSGPRRVSVVVRHFNTIFLVSRRKSTASELESNTVNHRDANLCGNWAIHICLFDNKYPFSHSFPVIPIAVAAGGTAILLVLLLIILIYRCRRLRQPRRAAPLEGSPLGTEVGRRTPGPADARSFSRMTFSAPYVLPRSPTSRSASTAAPSTVSIGQQYRVSPTTVMSLNDTVACSFPTTVLVSTSPTLSQTTLPQFTSTTTTTLYTSVQVTSVSWFPTTTRTTDVVGVSQTETSSSRAERTSTTRKSFPPNTSLVSAAASGSHILSLSPFPTVDGGQPVLNSTQSSSASSVRTASATTTVSFRIGVAVGGVVLVMLIALTYIVIRRRALRRRAIIRLGEEF
ncbi:hypothetical protein HMN09_00888100 [Mycena chlorophos]|uniref:Uncharacterized protein n=1 Tax=Mycena chlorophos TaxID=658473 RepID=A0A8H6W2G7_MYCCL|nr:hypothetical protein HMN09_00888100 [Mycena chlorophos]